LKIESRKSKIENLNRRTVEQTDEKMGKNRQRKIKTYGEKPETEIKDLGAFLTQFNIDENSSRMRKLFHNRLCVNALYGLAKFDDFPKFLKSFYYF
jgi:hypothetical protein